MQWNEPLTLTLSPSDGERESFRRPPVASPFSDCERTDEIFSLPPSDGERAGVRGFSDCMDTACAGEAGCHAGESPAGRIGLFTTESCVRDEAARPNPKARRRLNCPVATTVNLI